MQKIQKTKKICVFSFQLAKIRAIIILENGKSVFSPAKVAISLFHQTENKNKTKINRHELTQIELVKISVISG